MRCCSACSGSMPRASASQTSSTASGRITNCGRITPLMISVARRERLPSVSATCTSGEPDPSAADGPAPTCRRRAPPRCAAVSSRNRTSPGAACSSSVGGREHAAAAQDLAARVAHLVADVVASSSGRSASATRGGSPEAGQPALAARPGRRPRAPSSRDLGRSSRSNGWLAMPWATSQVSATLIGHSSSSGASIQSRISPKSERCSRHGSSAKNTLRGSTQTASRRRLAARRPRLVA